MAIFWDDFLDNFLCEDDPISAPLPAPSAPPLLTGDTLKKAIQDGVHYNDIKDHVPTDIRQVFDGIVYGGTTEDYWARMRLPSKKYQWLFTPEQMSACKVAIEWINLSNSSHMDCRCCRTFHFPWHLIYKNLHPVCYKCKDKPQPRLISSVHFSCLIIPSNCHQ